MLRVPPFVSDSFPSWDQGRMVEEAKSNKKVEAHHHARCGGTVFDCLFLKRRFSTPKIANR